MRAKHAATGQKDIVLVPAPSSDPDDPLNWSPRRKLLSTSCMCMYTLMVSTSKRSNRPPRRATPNSTDCSQVGIASAAIYSVLVPISEATGLTLGDLNAGTGYMYVVPAITLPWSWRSTSDLYRYGIGSCSSAGDASSGSLSRCSTASDQYTSSRSWRPWPSRCGPLTRRPTVSGSRTRSCRASSAPPLNHCARFP